MSVHPKIIAEAQKFRPDDVVILYDLDMRSLGGSIFRFSPDKGSEQSLLLERGDPILLANQEAIGLEEGEGNVIKWRGEDYLPIPADASGFEISSSGPFPRPTLTVANLLNVFTSELQQRNNLKGATVTRWRTFAKHLDDGADPDPDIYFPPDIYKIDRKASDDGSFLTFELATVIDQEGVMLPRRQILRNTCTHIYRVWDEEAGEFDYTKATCPYSDDEYFDANGNRVADPALDKASKLVESCCKKRFVNQSLPTRAFPGVGRFR